MEIGRGHDWGPAYLRHARALSGSSRKQLDVIAERSMHDRWIHPRKIDGLRSFRTLLDAAW